ncbi:MAG: T9SS type A sorting domain-containing protein [Bacteroidales bacterium]|nr:T9SS type A sorting domain-containing protein [Bacteroidales bacterium]
MKTRCIVLLFAIISLNLCAQFSREDAIEIMINQVVGPDSLLVHHLYSKYDIMYVNDTLWLDGFYEYYVCPFEEQWVFFIDDLPIANWAHSCRIIFFDLNSSEYQVHGDDWPPHPFLYNIYLFFGQWEWIMSIGIENNPSITPKSTFNIYPNPTVSSIKIEFEPIIKVNFHYRIIDSFGITRLSGSINKQSSLYEINLQNLNNGLYYLYILRNNSIIESKKIIKSS